MPNWLLLVLVYAVGSTQGKEDELNLPCAERAYEYTLCPYYSSILIRAMATPPIEVYTDKPSRIRGYFSNGDLLTDEDCFSVYDTDWQQVNATHPAVISTKRKNTKKESRAVLLAVEKLDTSEQCKVTVTMKSKMSGECPMMEDAGKLCEKVPVVDSRKKIPKWLSKLHNSAFRTCAAVECDCTKQVDPNLDCTANNITVWSTPRSCVALQKCVQVWEQCIALQGELTQTGEEVQQACNMLYNGTHPITATCTSDTYCYPPLVYPRTRLFWWAWLLPIGCGAFMVIGSVILATILRTTIKERTLQVATGIPKGKWAALGATLITTLGVIGAAAGYLMKFSPSVNYVELGAGVIIWSTGWAKISSGPIALMAWWAQHHWLVDLYLVVVTGTMMAEIVLAACLMGGFLWEVTGGHGTFWRFLVMSAVLITCNLTTAIFYVGWWARFRDYLYKGLPSYDIETPTSSPVRGADFQDKEEGDADEGEVEMEQGIGADDGAIEMDVLDSQYDGPKDQQPPAEPEGAGSSGAAESSAGLDGP